MAVLLCYTIGKLRYVLPSDQIYLVFVTKRLVITNRNTFWRYTLETLQSYFRLLKSAVYKLMTCQSYKEEDRYG